MPYKPACGKEYQVKQNRLVYGRMLGLLFHFPPLTIELEYSDGGKDIYRVVPDVLKNGIFINQVPANSSDMIKLLRGESIKKVCRFRLGGAARPCFIHDFRVQWIQFE